MFTASTRRRRLHRGLLLAALALLAACSTVPFDYPKQPSQALPPPTTGLLANTVSRWREHHGVSSGFVGLPNGTEALGARLKMMDRAQATIDAQYFLIKPDRAGGLFVGGLLLAADRGVRVRLLIDDIFTPTLDSELTLLDAHANIEVRIFNPIARFGFKYGNYLLDFKRANRRMHNKSFVIDNSLAIVGGRNIAEEYFELEQDVQFDDYEVLTLGPVVADISHAFDDFWNSELAVPVAAFGREVDEADLEQWRTTMAEVMAGADDGIYVHAVNSRLLRDLEARVVQPFPAVATLVSDHPEKLQYKIGEAQYKTLANELERRFDDALYEIVIITPYFVPQDKGATELEEALARGVDVVLVTNSLASTNHVAVHSGYTRYRKRLLQAGARIFEIKADAVRVDPAAAVNPEMITLHSKATIIDRDTIFIGSLNFDPRSLAINTEIGLFIESAEGGESFYRMLSESLSEICYEVVLDERGNLQWLYEHAGVSQQLESEPLAGPGRRFMAGLYRWLPIEDQL